MSGWKSGILLAIVICLIPLLWYQWGVQPSPPPPRPPLRLTQTTWIVHGIDCGVIAERSSPPSVPVVVLGTYEGFSYGIEDGTPVIAHTRYDIVDGATRVFWCTEHGLSEYSGPRLMMTSREALEKLSACISARGDVSPESVFKSSQEIFSVLSGETPSAQRQ